MRNYTTFCEICGKETRNSNLSKPIDICSVCIALADRDRKKKEKEERIKKYAKLKRRSF